MKKITKINNLALTIIMVVILIVALSTATFAWFSASNIVNLSKMEFSISSRYGYGDLKVSWKEYQDYMTNETAQSDLHYDLPNITVWGSVVDPAMPNVKPYVGMSSSDFRESLHTGEVVAFDGGMPKYRGNGIHTEPAILNNDKDIYINNNLRYLSDFYLYNVNENYDLEVTLEISNSEGSSAEFFLIGVFVDDGLVGFVGGPDRVYYGPIVGGQEVDYQSYVSKDLTYDSKTAEEDAVMSEESISFRVSTYRRVKLLFYFDGMNVSDSDEHQKNTVDLRIMGEYIEKE